MTFTSEWIPLVLYEAGGFLLGKDVETMCGITIDLYKTGLNIRSIREEKGITVREIQKELGFTSPQAIYKWQDGKCLPTLDNIIILARLFEVSVEDIVVID